MTSRIALVTGGGGGIGRQICVELGAQGHRVAAVDLNAEAAAETAAQIVAAGGRAMAVTADVADSDSTNDAIFAVVDELGPVEILINCAGWDRFLMFLETDEDLWDRLIEINYKGVLRTVHACLPAMIEAGWGRIVNISSDAALVGSTLEAVYAGAKGAIISFTKTIAREVARHGITANVICPGPTDTALLSGIADTTDDAERIVGALARAVPMKRLGQPGDIAPAVAYFASDQAGFVTGQTLSVSGGLTMSS